MGKSRAAAKGNQKERREVPFVVYVWAIGLGFFGYLIIGRFALAARPHPYHWAAGLLGIAVGVIVGWLWYRWRGDIVPGGGR